MSKLAALPQRPPLEALPIPVDVLPNASWSASLLEMAAHIGAYRTLLLHERFGGMTIYVPKTAEGWHVAEIIGAEAATKLAFVVGRGNLDLPLASAELWMARATPLIAAIRSGDLTYSEAAWQLHTTRQRLWREVNPPAIRGGKRPRKTARRHFDHRQLELLEDML
jgi:hypothetical protein